MISPELAAAGAALQSTLGLEAGASIPRFSALDAKFQQALGGEFDIADPKHQALAFGLTALVGEKLRRDHRGFWFTHGDAVGGASVGFTDALLPVSPSAMVSLALRAGDLAALDAAFADVQQELAAAQTWSKTGRKLDATDYGRLYDPSFLEFSTLDSERAQRFSERSPLEVASLLQDALFRAPGLTRQARHWIEDLASALRSMDGKQPLVAQAAKHPRVFERITHLFGATYGTGPISMSGWTEVALKLLCLDPSATPPAPADAKTAVARSGGVVPLYLATAPRLAEAPREGILGVFAPSELQPVDKRLGNLGELRMVGINPRTLLPLLQQHDAKKLQDAVRRFASAVKSEPSAQETAMLDDALAFLRRLQDTLAYAIRDQHNFLLLRVSQLEAKTSASLGELRKVLEG